MAMLDQVHFCFPRETRIAIIDDADVRMWQNQVTADYQAINTRGCRRFLTRCSSYEFGKRMQEIKSEPLDVRRKPALVTGASSGLGMRLARVLARNGAKVGLAARRVEALKALAKELSRDDAETAHRWMQPMSHRFNKR
jgi:hypothetical protein